MHTDAKAGLFGEKRASLPSLPNEILEKVIHLLSFKDRCSGELIDKHFNALLSNPSPLDGLWGICNLMVDLKLIKNFEIKEDLIR